MVIIGGGVTGASTAFHLTQRGVRDVVVVDKGSLASGGTGRSSACVRQHYSTAETCRMIRYSLDFFQHARARRARGAGEALRRLDGVAVARGRLIAAGHEIVDPQPRLELAHLDRGDEPRIDDDRALERHRRLHRRAHLLVDAEQVAGVTEAT